MNNKQDRKNSTCINTNLFYAGIIILCAFILAPFFFLILTSLKSPDDFYGKSVFSLPAVLQFSNYSEAFFSGKLSRYMLNGFILCVLKVPLGILIEALAAFGITRLKMKNGNLIFILFLIGMMIPMQITLVPLNIGLRFSHLSNTYLGLIIVYLGFGIPFGILILRGSFRTIPAGLLSFIGENGCDYGRLTASVIITIIPVLIIFISFQRYFVEDMGGAVKG